MTPSFAQQKYKKSWRSAHLFAAKPERNEAISLMGFKYLLFGTSNSSNKWR